MHASPTTLPAHRKCYQKQADRVTDRTDKEKELAAKSDEAAAAIGLETADVAKEKDQWLGKQTAFEAEIAELMRQLELKKAEV